MRKPVTLTQPKKHTPVTGQDLSKIPVNGSSKVPRAYVFCHYPGCWEYDSEFGLGWLPRLNKLISMPGVNGVPQNGDMSGYLQAVAQMGGTVIDPNDRRLIETENEDDSIFYQYPRYYETTAGGKWWCEPGECPTITLTGQVLWDRKKIRKASADFRKHLRDTGIVQPMHHLTLQHELAKVRTSIERLAARVGLNPHLAAQLADKETEAEQMQTEWDQMQAEGLKQGTTLPPVKAKRVTPNAKRGQP